MTAPADRQVSWRYTFCDLLTRRPLARLPLVDAELSEVIGAPADGTGRIPLTNATVRAADPWAATRQRRTLCFAQRIVTAGDTVVAQPCLWAGIVWKRVRSGTDLKLTMSTVESYWRWRLAADHTFAAADDAVILRSVLADAEATPSGGLGIALGASTLGTYSDRTVAASDLKTVLETAQSVAATNAFEWRILPGYDPSTGAFTLSLLIGRPLGATVLNPALVWTTAPGGRPGNEVLAYELTEDGGNVPNRVVGMGAGQPPSQLRSVATSVDLGPDELAAGYPLMETALNSSTQDLVQQATLDAHTRSELAAMRAGERQITSLVVRGDRGPTVDTYGLGDAVGLNLNDPLQQTPLTLSGRVLARKIQPVQPGRTERVAMTLGVVA